MSEGLFVVRASLRSFGYIVLVLRDRLQLDLEAEFSRVLAFTSFQAPRNAILQENLTFKGK